MCHGVPVAKDLLSRFSFRIRLPVFFSPKPPGSWGSFEVVFKMSWIRSVQRVLKAHIFRAGLKGYAAESQLGDMGLGDLKYCLES